MTCIKQRASTYQHREAAARRAARRCCGRGRRCRRRGTGGPGRSMAVRRRLGWRSSSAARPPTVWRRRSARWRQGWRFSRRCWGSSWGVAAVAAATVRRLVDGSTKAGVLAGCLTLTAAQVIQLLLVGDIQNFSQTVTVGCTALLAAGGRLGVCAFSGAGAAGRLSVAGGGHGLPAALCRRAFGSGLALAAGAGLCAAMAGTLEQTAVLSIALAVAITASGPALAFAALAVALGSLAAACLCPGSWRCAGVLRRAVRWARWRPPMRCMPCRWPSVPGWVWRRRWRCPRGHCAGSFPAGPACAGAGAERCGAQAVRRGGCPERHCRHGERRLPAADAAEGGVL